MIQSCWPPVSLSDTAYYHCISCCVRRAYLCGEDKYTEKSFERRRQWAVERMHYLFNIDICAYVIMSNHYDLVLHVDEILNENVSHGDAGGCECQLYSKPVLIERWQNALTVSETENKATLEIINGWRGWLADSVETSEYISAY